MKTRLALGRWLLMLGLVGCQSPLETSTTQYAVFGTTVEVTIRHSRDEDPTAVLAELGQQFWVLHQRWHPWEPGALTQLNEGLSTGLWITIPSDLAQLLRDAQAMEINSGGRFNAAMGHLVGLWGFHTSIYPITSPPPSPETIAKWVDQAPSTQDIEWMETAREEPMIRTHNQAVALDFSGLAKGAVAKAACDQLIGAGFDQSLVNLGGDVLVCGPTDRPWRVAIRDPRSGVLEVKVVDTRLAIFTSGQYYRFGEWDGERYAHVLNPATGYPIEHIMQATAIDEDPIKADAAATALVVAGPEQAERLAQAMGLSEWIIVNESGEVTRSQPRD